MNENLTPFTSDTARRAAHKSALSRSIGAYKVKTIRFTLEQCHYLAALDNESELIRYLLDQHIAKIAPSS